MKKILLSTSAIVGVGLLATPAFAQAKRVSLAVGGYMEQYVGYADAKRKKTASFDLADWDTQSDAEVYFSGSTKLDNGITFSVMVELEADEPNSGTIDESYVRIISPTLGELRIGGDDSVDGIMVVQANRGLSGDYDNWIVEDGMSKNDNLYDGGAGDVNKVSYFTPKIAGFQAGVSYSNISSANTTSVDPPNYRTATVGGPLWAAAATYEAKLGGVDLKLGANMSRRSSSNASAGRDNYAGGAQLGFAGFSLSGGYAVTDQKINATNATIDNLDGERYQIGLQYATGPYTVGIWHMNDTHEGLTSIAKDDETKVYTAYGQYVLSDGVRLEGMVFKVDYKHEVDAAGNQLGGWGAVAGFRLDF